MDTIEQDYPQSQQQSPPDLTLNRDSKHPPSADDNHSLTLELQNLALKEAVHTGLSNVVWEDVEQKANDEDGKLKQDISQELYHFVLKQVINESVQSKFVGEDSNQLINEVALDSNSHSKSNEVVKQMDHEFLGSVEARVFDEIEDVHSVKDNVKDKEGLDHDGWNDGIEQGKNETHEFDGWNDGVEQGKEIDYQTNEFDGWNDGVEQGKEIDYQTNEFDGWNGGVEQGNRKEVDYQSAYHAREGSGAVGVHGDGNTSGYHYPVRPDAEDCSFYMRTGACKFGSNCKFNHPLKKKNQPYKQTLRQKDENSDRSAQTECKYYLSSGGCKYGKACKFSHSRGRPAVAPIAEFNFLGLPIRKGEKECPFYMRTGSCKYGSNCRFNHPDPTAVGGDSPVGYGNGESSSSQGPLQTTSPWSPRPLNEPAPYPPMMYSPPTQGIPPPNPEWNGYQAPVHTTSERSLPTPQAFALNNSTSGTSLYTHHQQQMLVGDFPERPGQPECSYFLKTGDCKYRSACKFHHPKSRSTNTFQSVLSDKGLPLRPDQNICSNYSRYGICKYGPSCKYDHPVNYFNPAFGGGSGPRTGGSGMGRESLIQQSV